MRWIPSAACLLLAVCAVSPVSGKKGRGPSAEPPAYGFQKLEIETGDGEVLRVSVYSPALRPRRTVPLVLALHYGGEVTPYYGMPFLRALVAPAFRDLGAILVAPDCPGRDWTDPVSERAVLDLLDRVLEMWPVDAKRVAITGFSMGGAGAWFLAERHPDRFGAAVPVAGRPARGADPAVPVFAVHSRDDEVVASGPTERAIRELRARGGTAELVLLEGVGHYRTDAYVEPLSRAVGWLERIWSKTRAKKVAKGKQG